MKKDVSEIRSGSLVMEISDGSNNPLPPLFLSAGFSFLPSAGIDRTILLVV